MWPVRPNDGTDQKPTSYNVYWDTIPGGTFANLLGSVENISRETQAGNKSYKGKVVLDVIPSKVPGWDNDVTNYVTLKAVVGGVLGSFEDVVPVPSYQPSGLRLNYPELRTAAIVGYNAEANQFVPVSVDSDGKLETA